MSKIKDCGESLVKIKKFCPELVIASDIEKDKTCYLRKTVVEKICRAQKLLPEGMTFYIESAWRSAEKQQNIFKHFVKKYQEKVPSCTTEKEAIKIAHKYVAPYKGKYASGHMTGGAVDLRLYKNGRQIPMRSSKLNYQENSKPFQPKLSNYLQKNREIMFKVLKKVGFFNNPKEFWHWSYGDIYWAEHNNREAIYDICNKK